MLVAILFAGAAFPPPQGGGEGDPPALNASGHEGERAGYSATNVLLVKVTGG